MTKIKTIIENDSCKSIWRCKHSIFRKSSAYQGLPFLGYSSSSIALLLLILLISVAEQIQATPPNYRSFERIQKINPNINSDDLVRIWMIYVGQGDSILIQIPGHLTSQDPPQAPEKFDVLVDTGSYASADAKRAHQFLKNLYETSFSIEHIVISHHDKDHVFGINHILEDDDISVETIWHNGLASYLPDKFNLSESQLRNTVNKKSGGTYTRIMGELVSDGSAIQNKYLVVSKNQLRKAHDRGEYQGIYSHFAKAVLDKSIPNQVSNFKRAVYQKPFIGVDNDSVSFDLLWPSKKALKIGDWGETINGNSVTFRFKFRDFEMLFTGDHNEKSEVLLVNHLETQNQLDLLKADVLKVPHHGSSHADEDFFRSNQINPVISVASMGKKGFESNWKHPAEKVIKFVGGPHRFYSTYIHEKRFKYGQLNDQDRSKMRELKHILIETDGHWFRVVEIPVSSTDLKKIPIVKKVKRSNGTRWISTREGN